MSNVCHRCHAELPGSLTLGSSSDQERPLFCFACGAPQVLLPEYMRVDLASDALGSPPTTGAVPPPRPQLVEWSTVLLCALPIAFVTAALIVLAQVRPETGFLGLLATLTGTGIVIGLYRARRPLAHIDRRAGWRIGLLTGMLMITAIGIGLSAGGVIDRYLLHGMAAFDADAQHSQQMGMDMMNQMLGTQPDPERRKLELSMMSSPEIRAGSTLFSLALGGAFILLFNMVCGAFSGALQSWRRPLPRGK